MQPSSLITGGGRGIGRAIALRLARSRPVVVVGRGRESLDDLAREIEAVGSQCLVCAGDVADRATAQLAVAAARERGWWIEHLVCNAGVGKGGPTETFDPETWRNVFDVNVHGTF